MKVAEIVLLVILVMEALSCVNALHVHGDIQVLQVKENVIDFTLIVQCAY